MRAQHNLRFISTRAHLIVGSLGTKPEVNVVREGGGHRTGLLRLEDDVRVAREEFSIPFLLHGNGLELLDPPDEQPGALGFDVGERGVDGCGHVDIKIFFFPGETKVLQLLRGGEYFSLHGFLPRPAQRFL